MKTSTKKCSEKELLSNKGVRKSQVEIHEKYCEVVYC